MYNSNGPPRGSNVVSDQSSYDLVYKDIVISSELGTQNGNTVSFNLSTDSINQIYKAELISATINFNTTIPTNIKNNCIILSIPQLNGNTTKVAGNVTSRNPVTNQVYNPATGKYEPVSAVTANSGQGSNIVQGAIFCQIPDNNTPLTQGGVVSNNIISLLIGAKVFETTQFYNPPVNKVNQIDVSWFDTQANQIPLDNSISGAINKYYFTLRIHYFQKRYNTTAFSTSVYTNAATGTMDSIFQPSK
jgi:hypothetical protein